jgi:nitroreductase
MTDLRPDAAAARDARLKALAELMRERRTIALFDAREVPQDLVMQALDVARWAPNHHVTEPWQFYLLGPGGRARMIELVRQVATEKKGEKAGEFKAQSAAQIPGWIIVTCRRSTDPVRQREDYAACACAIQNLALYLWQAGVGCKWSTGSVLEAPGLAAVVGHDAEAEEPVAIVRYGFPRIVPQQTRRDVDEILTVTD